MMWISTRWNLISQIYSKFYHQENWFSLPQNLSMAIRFKHRVLKYADFIFKFSKGFKTDYISFWKVGVLLKQNLIWVAGLGIYKLVKLTYTQGKHENIFTREREREKERDSRPSRSPRARVRLPLNEKTWCLFSRVGKPHLFLGTILMEHSSLLRYCFKSCEFENNCNSVCSCLIVFPKHCIVEKGEQIPSGGLWNN